MPFYDFSLPSIWQATTQDRDGFLDEVSTPTPYPCPHHKLIADAAHQEKRNIPEASVVTNPSGEFNPRHNPFPKQQIGNNDRRDGLLQFFKSLFHWLSAVITLISMPPLRKFVASERSRVCSSSARRMAGLAPGVFFAQRIFASAVMCRSMSMLNFWRIICSTSFSFCVITPSFHAMRSAST